MRLEPQNTRLWTFLGYSLSAVKQVRSAESFALRATRILRSPPGEIENIDGTDFDSIVARIWVARLRGLATTEVKLFEAAVARDPGFFGRIGNGLRSAAVRATARALVATDDREVRPEENERLRRLARRWLAEKTTGLEGALMNEDLSEDEVLELAAALRDDDALRDLRRRLAESTLAADESKAWSEAWIALDHLIDKTR